MLVKRVLECYLEQPHERKDSSPYNLVIKMILLEDPNPRSFSHLPAQTQDPCFQRGPYTLDPKPTALKMPRRAQSLSFWRIGLPIQGSLSGFKIYIGFGV